MKKYIFLLLALLSTSYMHAKVDFKESSVLSTGKWVKIKVGRSGVYEIPYERLQEFGFTDPSRVKVFGMGGIAATEGFTEPFTDDLPQVPALHENNTIYFYARSLSQENISSSDGNFYNQLKRNTYSNDSYYFLTDNEAIELAEVPTQTNEAADASQWFDSGIDFWTHEAELTNLARSGKQFLGENFSSTGNISFTIPLPQLADGQFTVYASTGIKSSTDQTVAITVDNNEITYNDTNIFSQNESDSHAVYDVFDISGAVAADKSKNTVSVKLTTSPGNVSVGRIDYLTVGYPAVNAIPADSAQARRFYNLPTGDEGIRIANATPTTHAWIVDDSNAYPDVAYPIAEYSISIDDSGHGIFYPAISREWVELVYFDTSKKQFEPEFAEIVENQNLHASATPDMLIITTANLARQAERIADYHRTHDDMDVAVVDHNKIFNEFSSGTPDAMAYRRIAKMYYQRDSKKFRYLLLFGGGTYDNRQIFNQDKSDKLLTWQSDESSHDVNSYSSDDFFGVFSETNNSIELPIVNIAIGRIQFVVESEMKEYVDKLLDYMENIDNESSVWRNNLLLIGENGDDDIHAHQCETFVDEFEKNGNYDMNISKIYMAAYDEAMDTRHQFVNHLDAGQNFVLFVGHSSIQNMSKSTVLMDAEKASETKYAIPPIMYFSSCDVGRYDIGQVTFIDRLMLNNHGGIIAAISATRQAYTTLNGKLSDAFGKYLGRAASTYGGEMTIGRILANAKNYCNDNTKNRLKYHLLGDPAMRVRLPQNDVELTEINGIATDGETINAGLGDEITLKGHVTSIEGIDAEFNGYASIALFDSEKNYLTINYSGTEHLTDRGEILAQSGAEIVNGEFTAKLTIPGQTRLDGGIKPLRIFAVSDDKRTIVSGKCEALAVSSVSENSDPDDIAPTINSMYLNTSDFIDGDIVGQDCKVYAEVSDNRALNIATETISTSVYLSLDGETAYSPSSFTLNDGKWQVIIPLYDLPQGRHTARLVATDLAGNAAERTISFFVEAGNGYTIDMEEAAVRDIATIVVKSENGELIYENAEIRVTDDSGNILFRENAASIPFEWDGKNNAGFRLPAGVYNLYGIVDGVGTNIKKIVVTEQ